jgi:hypothetical protein
MTKFNLKEHIAKNKATFFGSLTEGQFSWMTQDTGQQIGSQDENKISVYMFDNKGKYWFERDYEGYGVFGGKDYYELLDQMNGGSGDRSKGIDLAFDKSKEGETLFPALVVSPSNFNYKTHDFTKEAEHDPNQSWYEPEEDDFYDQNDEEVYGYDDDEEELEEGEAAYEYEKGKEAGEEIEKKKMKVSEFKAKIREMIVAEMNAPINMVTTMDGKTVVGTYKEGVGFKSNEAGQKMGFKDNPTSIPNGTKMSKNKSLDEMEIDVQDSAKENSLYDPLAESDFLAELEGMLDDEEEFSVTLLVPTVYYNPETGELAKTSSAFGADSELEDMGITNYSDGDELIEWVFDGSLEKAKYFEKEYPGLFKVEGAMNEAEDDKHIVMKGNKFYTGTEFVDDMKDAMKYNLKSATEIAKEKKGMVYTPKAVKEAKKDEEVEDEVDIDIESPEAMDAPMGGINVTQNADADLTGTEKEVQDNLEAAMEAAKKLGDEKLSSQIGNTLTFFTRQHVVKEELNEVKFKIGDTLQTYGGGEEVKVLDIKPNLAAALADIKNPKAVKELEKDLRQDLIDREDRNKPFYLVTSESFPVNKYYVESELEGLINESMFPMLKKILK